MTRKKGKKPKTGDKMIGQPIHQIQKAKKYSVPPSLSGPVGPTISEHESTGFIFMCSPSTKLECYQYRVFGLPSGMKYLVEVIKPGTKLFLFDFQLKLLYGVYEATSAGTMNLEPTAFSGRFPAQVKFKIFKECLPLPENSLRHIIRENYTGTKFKQELSGTQVTKLLSSFRPLTASSSQLALETPSSSTRHHQFTERLPSVGPSYLGETQHNHIPPFVEPQHFSRVNDLPHGYHSVYPAVDLQSLTQAIGYYVGNSERPNFTAGVAHGVQGPSSYSRAIEERPPHDHVPHLERRYIPIADGISHDQVPLLSSYPNVPVNQVADFERRYHQQLPLQRESTLVYQDNAAAYNPSAPSLYNNNTAVPSVTQPQQVHTPHQYQDTHNYNPAPSSSDYTALSALYQVNAAAAAAAYNNSCSAALNYNTYSDAPPSSELTAPSSLHQNGNGVVYNSTQYGIEASGVYGNNSGAGVYAPPAAQVQVSSLNYSYDSGNHQSQR